MLVAARQLKEGLGQVTFKQVFFADNLRIAASSRGPAGPGALHPAAFPRRLHPHRGVPAPLGAPSRGEAERPGPGSDPGPRQGSAAAVGRPGGTVPAPLPARGGTAVPSPGQRAPPPATAARG